MLFPSTITAANPLKVHLVCEEGFSQGSVEQV